MVSGPTALQPPANCEMVRVETAEQMRQAVLSRLQDATVVIKAAAVADYRVKNASAQKIKRTGPTTIELEPNPDILAEVAAQRGSRVVIGFAAETENAVENARRKLDTKSVDAIVVNDVSRPGVGFDSERNKVSIVTSDRVQDVPEMTKREVARHVLDVALQLRRSRSQRHVGSRA
jgi:phosphopantothenoylcysteine decarboxylase/phosphopantothenate--cysteine ligase